MTLDNSLPPSLRDKRTVTEQAADWVVELADGGPQDRAAFLEWVTESPRHVEEYLLAAALFKTLYRVDYERQIDLCDVLSGNSLNVHTLRSSSSELTPPMLGKPMQRHRWLVAAAAALIATCAIGLWELASPGGHTYSTTTGELRSIELPDGSFVDLNTRTKVDVRFAKDARSIRLLAGEALFKVAPDPARPFLVYTDTAVIRALGTQFNVYQRQDETAVAVIEGAVQVSNSRDPVTQPPQESSTSVVPLSPPVAKPVAAKLTAGTAVRVSANGVIRPVVNMDPGRVTAWREHRLVFVDDKLSDIVAEFNRYNSSPQLRVEGAYASARQLTGVFDASDPRSLVQFLRNLGEFSVSEKADEIVIQAVR